MEPRSTEYRENAAATLRDKPAVRDAVTGATLHFDRSRERGYDEIDIEAWRSWAGAVKSHALTHLDRMLDEAARNLAAKGVTVHWAATAADARAITERIVAQHGVRRTVKGKSMLSEELGINEHLEAAGVEVFETDLGEYILQLLDEPPSHILGPAIHRSLEDIRALFHERLGTPIDASPDALAASARSVLRDAFLTADLGITGANFVVAETGTVALIENEGNIRLSTGVPRVHIALVGIEKVLPRWTDLAPFLELTSRAATGQRVGTFVTLVQGPRSFGRGESEPDGPDHVHVVFVDNGRSGVLADERMWEILRCVRCGACLNVCPVYRQTGGHAYGWVYSGPLGAVLDPGLLGLEHAHPLPFASTLCGACSDVCPVRIPIPDLLLEWRRRAVAQGLRPASETRAMRAFATLASKPWLFRLAGRALRTLPRPLRAALPVLKDWARERALPEPSKRTFLDAWKREPDVEAGVAAPRVDVAVAASGVGAGGSMVVPPVDEVPATSAAQDDSTTRGATSRRAFAGGSLGPRRTDEKEANASPGDGDRDAVLERVRRALAGRTRAAHPGALVAFDDASPAAAGDAKGGAARPPSRATDRGGDAVQRFMERMAGNGASVVRFATVAEATAWLDTFAADAAGASVGATVPPALSPLHRQGAVTLPPETAGLGVSMARCASAETGTVILDSRDGRRTQLLPPSHLVWVRSADVHATLSAALDAVRDDLPAAIGLHSGPSRSADIGRVLVTGVHGPGVVMVGIIP